MQAQTTAAVLPSETEETALAVKLQDNDHELIERIQQGDIAAFNALARKYRARIYSVLYNMTGNREDAADLLQESFIKAFRSLGSFRQHSAFYTWLYRIAVNAALTHLKKANGRRFFSFDSLDLKGTQGVEFVQPATPHSGSDSKALLGELQEKLNEALQKLSDKHRTVVILFEIEGLSHAEIADVTQTSVGTVRSRLHYAKQQLQGLLKDYIG